MLNIRVYIDCYNMFDPYNMLPIEETITCLGDRR